MDRLTKKRRKLTQINVQKIHGEREIIIYFAKFCHGKTFVEYDNRQFFDVWHCHKNNVYKFNKNLKILNNLIVKGENNLSELELQNLEGLFDTKNKIFFDSMYKKFNDKSLIELIQLRKNKSNEYITHKLKRNRLEAYNYLLMGDLTTQEKRYIEEENSKNFNMSNTTIFVIKGKEFEFPLELLNIIFQYIPLKNKKGKVCRLNIIGQVGPDWYCTGLYSSSDIKLKIKTNAKILKIPYLVLKYITKIDITYGRWGFAQFEKYFKNVNIIQNIKSLTINYNN